MNKDVKISVITICFNGVNEIEKTILSVINQKDVFLEYIVVDGGSTDGTLDVIGKYKNNIDIVVSEHDDGIYNAINKGIRLSSGDLIGLIHCGDVLKTDVLQLCASKYLINRAEIIYGNIEFSELVGSTTIYRTAFADHLKLNKKMSLYHPATLISKECYTKFGLYDEFYRIASDYHLLLNCFIKGARFEYINIVIATFQAGGTSSSTSKLRKEVFLIWRAHLGYCYALRNIIKRTVKEIYFDLRKAIVLLVLGTDRFQKKKINRYSENG